MPNKIVRSNKTWDKAIKQDKTIHILGMLKYNLIQSSDENSIYKTSEKKYYYSEPINAHWQEVIAIEVTEC